MSIWNVAALIAVLLAFCFCGAGTDKYVCEHKENKLYYLELTNDHATVRTWGGTEVASERIERLGEHRFQGPRGGRGEPGMMEVDMVASYLSPDDKSVVSFYAGCKLIGNG